MSFSILRLFFFSSRRRHTRYIGDWSSDVCSSDLQRMSAIDNRLNEKVYTLSLLSIALILWLIVRWDDQPAGQAHDRSEERRVGKECRCRGAGHHEQKKKLRENGARVSSVILALIA